MHANRKYTAGELVTAAGFDVAQIGKVRVRIAGLRGISTPEHVIKIQAGTEKIEVMVGDETKEVAFEGDAPVETPVEEAAEAQE